MLPLLTRGSGIHRGQQGEQGGEKQRGDHPIRLWAQQDKIIAYRRNDARQAKAQDELASGKPAKRQTNAAACDAGPYPGKSADGPAAGAYPSGKFVGNRRNHQHNRRPHQQQRHKPAP